MVNKIGALKEAFEIVAGDADFQMRYIDRIGIRRLHEKEPEWDRIATDEIALQLVDDREYIVTYMQHENLASAEFFLSYKNLSERLVYLLNGCVDDFWTAGALVDDVRWIEIRQMAKLCIEHMPLSIPDDTTVFVD